MNIVKFLCDLILGFVRVVVDAFKPYAARVAVGLAAFYVLVGHAHAVVLDLTSAGSGGVTEATAGGTAALPIFAVLVALTVGVMGFRKLRKG